MQFTKMHGLGNDYLYHFGELENASALSVRLSDRHFGIGSDGIITISESEKADFKMCIFNADGSEAMMCGNGIRCVGKYVFDKGYTNRTHLTVETLSGIKELNLTVRDQKVEAAAVQMGNGKVGAIRHLTCLDETVEGQEVSMGNPHFVIFCENAEEAPLNTLGAALEKHEAFDGGVNVEFAQKIGEQEIRMRVWERGSGITMACGTGACAVCCAAVAQGLCRKNEEITVHLDGGDLHISVGEDMSVLMKGPAATVCECEVEDV